MKKLTILSSLILIAAQNCGTAQELASFDTIDERSIFETFKMFTKARDNADQSSSSNLFEELANHSVVFREGRDEELRPLFVNAQADFELALVYWLKNKQIEECTCIIHTPAPPTPLCTNGEVSTGLVDSTISDDAERLLTIKKRPDIIREYLDAGGHLLAIYPQNGRTLRSEEQLAVFDDLIEKYPRLKAIELDTDQIPNDLSGATYLIQVSDSKEYVLSIRSYQANCPVDGKWAIWFGSLQDPVITERFEKILSLLKSQRLSF